MSLIATPETRAREYFASQKSMRDRDHSLPLFHRMTSGACRNDPESAGRTQDSSEKRSFFFQDYFGKGYCRYRYVLTIDRQAKTSIAGRRSWLERMLEYSSP